MRLNVFDVNGLAAGTLYRLNLNASYNGSAGEVTKGHCVTHYWTWQYPPPRVLVPEIVKVTDETVELIARRVNEGHSLEIPPVRRSAEAIPVATLSYRPLDTTLPGVASDAGRARRRRRLSQLQTIAIRYTILYLVELVENISAVERLVGNAKFVNYDSVVESKVMKLPDYSQFQSGQSPYYVTAMTEATSWNQTFTIGDRSYTGLPPDDRYYNAPLSPITTYQIWVGSESALGGTFRRRFESVVLRTEEEPGPPILIIVFIVLAALIILLLLIALAVLLYRRERERYIASWMEKTITTDAHLSHQPCLGDHECHVCRCAPCHCHLITYCDHCCSLPSQILYNVSLRNYSPNLPMSHVSRCPCETRKATSSCLYDDSLYVVKCSNPMTVEDLCSAYRKCQLPILEEFSSLPVGYVDPVTHSSLPRNSSYNRSFKCLPYDKNLLLLSDSSYINTSLIRTVSAYPCVVTQLPLPNSMAAFWRMVWEVDSGNLVTLDECGPTHPLLECESDTQCYGMVTVRTTSVERTAYYVRRRLSLCSMDSTRSSVLTHWYFQAWNGRGGIPVHRIPFIGFIRRVQRERDCCRCTVVQCRLGAGRSGLFVALDLLLTQGRTSGIVDVIKCVNLIRLERVKTVSTLRQYAFIYQCLAEEFDHVECRIHLSSFFLAAQRLTREAACSDRTPMEEEFLDLSYDRPPTTLTSERRAQQLCLPQASDHFQDKDHWPSAGKDPQDEKPILLDSFHRRDAFVLSLGVFRLEDNPLWDVVYDHRLHCIVLMQQFHNMGDLFSRRKSLVSKSCQISPRLTLTREAFKASQDKSFLVHDFTLRPSCPSENKSTIKVRLYEPLFWADSLTDGRTVTTSFLRFLAHIRHWTERQERCLYNTTTGDPLRRRPIVVCGNQPGAEGVHRAAVFALVWSLLEQTEVDTVIDVFSAVRFMRSRLNETIIQNYVSSFD